MRKSILSTLVMLTAAGSLTACDVEQPNPGCIVQDASFANWWAKYDVVSGPTGIKPDGSACGATEALEVGDNLGVWKFADPKTGSNILVVRPQYMARLGSSDANNTFDSLQVTGNLSADTTDDFCLAPTFNTATVNPTQAGVTSAISYTLANIKVYSSPSSPGTQMTGEVTFTRNGCTSTYIMRAVWPATGCDPRVDQNDPEQGFSNCGSGSGINPDFAVQCEAVPERFWFGDFLTEEEAEYVEENDEFPPSYNEGRCVPSNKIPSFK
ncbi:hypothetical protein HRD49_12785 [Corallococcus exiguus]|uniref:hypothetical protein n=1 Tax=Corallococcus TaxID=83461 RepID=UPI000EA09557|nr:MULTISPECIES: hypothetical protein [Corallococcus]NNC06005.1 hypothetical protein [Corallococcus exiguus]NNC20304.1 hypothetical protein [Corallococcus exiguus]NRD57998.1 hypothetical protein [Corallococcus exiguus]NRD62621.1 hypothetical protein [Corallococcus exiguus]RKH18863.1 hypothetical protein D7V77_33440 [Corallococcus sp. CA041A]